MKDINVLRSILLATFIVMLCPITTNAENLSTKSISVEFKLATEKINYKNFKFSDEVLLSEKDIKSAELVLQNIRGVSSENEEFESMPIINLVFMEESKQVLFNITKDNVDKNIGIFIDGQLLTAPMVAEPIESGEISITGNFSIEKATEVVDRVNNMNNK